MVKYILKSKQCQPLKYGGSTSLLADGQGTKGRNIRLLLTPRPRLV
jgi:hypothetical protein